MYVCCFLYFCVCSLNVFLVVVLVSIQEKKAAETAREKELEEAKDEKRRIMEAQRYIRKLLSCSICV